MTLFQKLCLGNQTVLILELWLWTDLEKRAQQSNTGMHYFLEKMLYEHNKGWRKSKKGYFVYYFSSFLAIIFSPLIRLAIF